MKKRMMRRRRKRRKTNRKIIYLLYQTTDISPNGMLAAMLKALGVVA